MCHAPLENRFVLATSGTPERETGDPVDGEIGCSRDAVQQQ